MKSVQANPFVIGTYAGSHYFFAPCREAGCHDGGAIFGNRLGKHTFDGNHIGRDFCLSEQSRQTLHCGV